MKGRPFSVISAPRVERSNSLTPSRSSSCCTFRLSVICLTLSAVAAREKLFASAVATAKRSCLISIVNADPFSALSTGYLRCTSLVLKMRFQPCFLSLADLCVLVRDCFA